MFKEAIAEERSGQVPRLMAPESIPTALVLQELNRIVSSRHFRTSRRGKEFLQYVVEQKINGHGDMLKERLIGVELFGRKPDYATGEDPVVRVQAGDVRRRLESYHADPEFHSELVIQIPIGSYAPVFARRTDVYPEDTQPAATSLPEGDATDEDTTSPDTRDQQKAELSPESAPHAPLTEVGLASSERPVGQLINGPSWRTGRNLSLAVLALLFAAGVAAAVVSYLYKSPERTLKAFWSPAAASAKPVLICLPRPIVYRPSEKLFDKFQESHPNAFATREARRDQILPLPPTETILWGDMMPVRNSGPGIGAVVAAINVSKLLAEQGVRFELRFGEEATYADMRESPVVIVGAINTEWATQLVSESAFVFDETRGAPNVHETSGAKRVWRMEEANGTIIKDYGLITRQLSGKAGQFLVQVAGISHFGTEAASELLANKVELTNALRSESINPREANFQIVVSTDITAGRAGPPHIVAARSW